MIIVQFYFPKMLQSKFNMNKKFELFYLIKINKEEQYILILLQHLQILYLIILPNNMLVFKCQTKKLYSPRLRYIYATIKFLRQCFYYKIIIYFIQTIKGFITNSLAIKLHIGGKIKYYII